MFGDFEEDPAADFLERERKELAGLEDDPNSDFFQREKNDLASVENDETWNNLQNDDANAGNCLLLPPFLAFESLFNFQEVLPLYV